MRGNLVDTNVIIKFFNRDERAVSIFTSIINIKVPVAVVGELFYGVFKSSRVDDNFTMYEDFLSNYEILPIDENIPVVYGEIKAQLT
jgi:tRNA(fMet)-specific endonuclease VapC